MALRRWASNTRINIIRLMSRFTIDDCPDSIDDEVICSICQELLDDPTSLPCRHVFCKECITPVTDERCPLCRETFQMSDLTPAPHALKNVIKKIKDFKKESAEKGDSADSEQAETEVKVMQIFVKKLDGRTITLDVQSSYTIRTVKTMVEERDGLPVREQRLIFSGKELENDKTLPECKIEKLCTLHLVLRMTGGMRMSL